MLTFDKYERVFRDKALRSGFSAEEIERCLAYAKPILDKNLPVIYNTSNLASLVGFNKNYLKRASAYTSYFYKEHSIPKKNGGTRKLYEPLPNLKEIQHWIAKNILAQVAKSRYAKAYLNGRSIKDHVKFHRGQKMVYTLDIENFFGSITLEMVNRLFLDFGYSDLVANLLAKLCCLKGSLPQGGPSSPELSNIILKPLDDFLSDYCRNNKLRYSRYADDLAFSGDEINTDELFTLISDRLKEIGGLNLNQEKTMVMKSNQRQVIAGIIVNSKIQVPREKRDELRQAMFYIEKFGLEDHLKRINCSKANYVKHLLGIANYITFVNPNDQKTQSIKDRLFKMLES